MIFFVLIFTLELSPDSFLTQLLGKIRCEDLNNTDSLWEAYTESLKKENRFTKYPHLIGAPSNINDYEKKFVNGEISEAEFLYFLGYEFAREAQTMESEWCLNKAESLDFFCVETYLIHASNYAAEWNNYLHHNEDPSDPYLTFYEEKWREHLRKFITSSEDSLAIENARLGLTSIYFPFKTPIFINEYAPIVIRNLEEFIDKYPRSKVIDNAYEQLVWWLREIKQFEKLKDVCLNFLKDYPTSSIKEYMKFQLGNSYLEVGDTINAQQIFKSVKIDSLPESVYPGWNKTSIIESLNNRLIELKN